MEVLVLAEDFYPVTAGGSYTDTEVAKAAASRGHDVTTVTYRLTDDPHRENIQGVDIHRPVRPPFTAAPMNSPRNALGRILAAIVVFWYVLGICVLRPPDVVYSTNHSMHPTARIAAILTGARHVSFVGYTPSLNDPSGNDILYRIEQVNFRYCMGDVIHCRTPEIKQVLTRHNRDATVQVTHGIINSNHVRSSRLRTEAPRMVAEQVEFDADATQVLFVGRLTELKRPTAAIDILAEVPDDYHLFIIGAGPQESATRAHAKDRLPNHRYRFLGELPHETTLWMMHQADVLLVTSKVEAYPTVVFEALACGCEVLATEVGILPHLSHDIEALHLSSVNAMPEELESIQGSTGPIAIRESIISEYSMAAFADRVCRTFEAG